MSKKIFSIISILLFINTASYAVSDYKVEETWDEMVQSFKTAKIKTGTLKANSIKNFCIKENNCLACEKYLSIPIVAQNYAKAFDNVFGTKFLNLVGKYAVNIYKHGCEKNQCQNVCNNFREN